MIQSLGYVAMILTILSFATRKQKRLRITNSIACILWIVYGIGIGELPIVIVNGVVISLNLIWLYKITFNKSIRNKRRSYGRGRGQKIMTQTEWNKERDKMAEAEKADPEFMYKWIKEKSGK